MTIPSFSKQSNVEERWGQTTSTTYERWRKRNVFRCLQAQI